MESPVTISRNSSDVQVSINSPGDSSTIAAEVSLCASSPHHNIGEEEVLPFVDPPPRSFSPGLHHSQIAGPSRADVPLVKGPPCIDKPSAKDLADPGGTTVERVLTCVSPEFTQEYAARNREPWVDSSQHDSSVRSAVLVSSPVRPIVLSPNISLANHLLCPGNSSDPIEMVRAFFCKISSNRQRSSTQYPLRQWSLNISRRDPEAWEDVIEEMLLTLFPEEERRRQKKRAKENKPSGGARGKTPSDNLAPPNRNQRRTAEYKKVQDLFSKNRKMLGDKIASGEPLDSPTIFPEMSAVMDVHGEVFRSTSPPPTTIRSARFLRSQLRTFP